MNQTSRRARRLPSLLAILTLALCGVAATWDGASADAPSSGVSPGIEGVWSFNGGTVDIVGQPNGTLVGLVTADTKFAQCVHKAGEQMWIEMRAQADGSYWGLHHWYYESSACIPNPTYGPTAWRVLDNSKGEAFLRVCFSEPGSGTQPTIAPDGSSAHVTYGCVDSSSIAPLPSAPAKGGAGGAFGKAVVLPPSVCHVVKSLHIKLRDPRYDPLKHVIVWVNGKKAADVSGVKKLKGGITLKHLPKGRFTVRVLAITVLDYRLSGKRSYGGCSLAGNKVGLKKTKGHHKHHK